MSRPRTASQPSINFNRNMLRSSSHDHPPWGLKWRSNTFFIVSTVGIGAFTDFFLYGLIVPVLPFMLEDRVQIPDHEIQSTISWLLALYAAASMIVSPIAGLFADRMTSSRQLPFLLGLALLLVSTILLAVGKSVPVIALARVLQGASGGTVWTIGLALLLETVGQENLGKAIGSVFSFTSVAGLFAPVIGGLLYAKSGYAGVFGVGIGLICVDFLMRLLMIEKKVAARYEIPRTPPPQTEGAMFEPEETSLLLPSNGEDLTAYRLPEPKQRITRALPILLLLKDPGMLTAFVIGIMQAILLGAFDATVPLVASSRYGFNSLKAGLLFLPLASSDFLLGPFFGWCVDRWGTKPITVIGFLYLVPTLVLLRIPTEAATDLQLPHQVAIYASLLLLNGIGLAIINSPSIVEAGNLIEKYWRANENLFEDQAPYAQLYGINSMLWSLGLTIGPLIAGKLKEDIGYGNMNAVLAGLCALTAVLGFLFIGGKVNLRRQRRNRSGEVTSAQYT